MEPGQSEFSLNKNLVQISTPEGPSPDPMRGHLYIGNKDGANNFLSLRTHSITAILNVANNVSIKYPTHENITSYHLPLTEPLGVMSNANIKNSKGSDASYKKMEELIKGAQDFITAHLGHTNVLVHCAGGINRSAAITTLWLSLNRPYQNFANLGYGDMISYTENYISTKRPQISINEDYFKLIKKIYFNITV